MKRMSRHFARAMKRMSDAYPDLLGLGEAIRERGPAGGVILDATMGFDEIDLRKARGRRVSLTLQFEPLRVIHGTLVYWGNDRLLLDRDTVVFEPAVDLESRPVGSYGMIAVAFDEIVAANL